MKRIILTGASDGLGREVGKLFLSRGGGEKLLLSAEPNQTMTASL